MRQVLLDHVLHKPGVGLHQGAAEVRRRLPSQGVKETRVQAFERHAVGLTAVEDKPAAVADDLRDGVCHLGDR
jgi:hypothetical protein